MEAGPPGPGPHVLTPANNQVLQCTRQEEGNVISQYQRMEEETAQVLLPPEESVKSCLCAVSICITLDILDSLEFIVTSRMVGFAQNVAIDSL